MPLFKLTVLSLRGKVYEGEAESVALPGLQGRFSVLAHHAPMIAALAAGASTVRDAAGEHLFFTSSGYAEVTREEVVVLVGMAQKVASMDEVASLRSEHEQLLSSADMPPP